MLVVMTVFLVTTGAYKRFINVFNLTDNNMLGRFDLWARAWDLFKISPLFGIGFARFNDVSPYTIAGEITGYKISPMTATAEQTAAQNRITITVNVRFYNNKLEEDNFERSFSFYHDFPADQSLSGSLLSEAYDVILERITQDIFNASVAKW